jgi:Putative MetA-pathway of phenol degradation
MLNPANFTLVNYNGVRRAEDKPITPSDRSYALTHCSFGQGPRIACLCGLAWVVASLTAGCVTARAQEASWPNKSCYTLFNPTPDKYMREMSPDRPDKTDSPFTVDAGHFQIEMDFANFTYGSPSSERDNIRSVSYQIAPMNLKVGVLNNMDFQLVLSPWQWQRIEDKSAGSIEQRSGFGDIIPRVKVNLVGNDGGFLALALIPFLKLPTNQDHLGNRAVEGGVGIPYAFDIPGWDVGFQTTFSFNRNDVGHGYHMECDNSVSIGHPLIGKLSAYMEFFSSVSTERGAGWVGTVDTWLTYQFNKNLRVDGGAYIGATGAADDWHPWLGMTLRY